MRCTALTLGLLCLAEQFTQVVAKNHIRSPVDGAFVANENLDDGLQRRAEAFIAAEGLVEREAVPAAPEASFVRRQSAAGVMKDMIVPGFQVTVPTEGETEAKCSQTLATLQTASNPSGMSACYNVDRYDNKTGEFRAHVLLYEISAPTGPWKDLQDSTEAVSLIYPGANARLNESTTPNKRELQPRAAPKLTHSMTFLGQLNKVHLAENNNLTAMRLNLSPALSLAAKTKSGQELNTTLSNTEASFVNGFFSNAEVAAAAQAAASAANTAFVLPGVTFGIFPVGFVICGIWTILFVATVGYGTWARYNFRVQFRRRAGVGPILGGRTAPAQSSGTAAYDRRR